MPDGTRRLFWCLRRAPGPPAGQVGHECGGAAAHAMQAHPHSAGAASALLGATQFLVGGAVGPLAGLGASDGPLLLGAVMTGLAVMALILGWAGRGGHQLARNE